MMMQNGRAAQATYVTLIAKDETVFMASRDTLVKASFFFEKRLKSGTDESREGIIRLHTITAPQVEIILKFIYNGRVQINNVENAKGLIVAADYLLLPSLRIFSEQCLEKRLCISNCISIFYFAKEHHCNELVAKVHSYIESNFANVAQSKEFLDLSSQEIENWISSDEIVITNEENIFEIIVQWTSQNMRYRMGEFKELFRHVRLMFVSRDYLTRSIATNFLVKEDAECLDCVTQALRWLDGKVDFDCDFPWQQLPRKSLQSQKIVACRQRKVLCHCPGEDKWQKLPDVQFDSVNLVSCRGKLFAIAQELNESQRYEPVFNKWVPLAKTELSAEPQVRSDFLRRQEQQVFAVHGEIYVIESDQIGCEAITRKYDFDSNSWKSAAFDLGKKDQVCIVPVKQFIYAIGGRKRAISSAGYVQKFDILFDVERFDIKENTWEKLRDIHEPRRRAFGAAVHDKIFIAGGIGSDCIVLRSCELYRISLDEWEVIASLNIPRMLGSMVCLSAKLYVLGGLGEPCSSESDKFTVESYDEVNGEWQKTTIMTFEKISEGSTFISVSGCSASLFNLDVNNLNHDSSTVESSHAAKTNSSISRTCCVM